MLSQSLYADPSGDRRSHRQSARSGESLALRRVESDTPEDVIRHRRMVAKLNAFIDPIDRTIRTHKDDPNSLEARYALAIAHYRRPDLEKATGTNRRTYRRLSERPLFPGVERPDASRKRSRRGSLEPYRMSVQLDPSSALLLDAYAQTQLNTGDPALLDGAIENLDFAATREPRVSFYWRQLAIAWGRKGNRGMNSLALAEEAILKRKFKEAAFYANRAAGLLPKGGPKHLQAQDILGQAQRHADDGRRK